MEFSWRSKLGRIGERRLQTKIEEEFGDICRLVSGDGDMGIDAEIELLNARDKTTGIIVKAQVKTTKKAIPKKSFTVPVQEKHLDYFLSLNVPAIFVVVSTAEDKIWWRPVLRKSDFVGPRGGYRVPFRKRSDELTRFNRIILRMTGERSNAMIAKYLAQEVDEQVSAALELYDSQDFDVVSVETWEQRIPEWKKRLADVDCLLRYERRFSDEITKIEEYCVSVSEKFDSISEIVNEIQDPRRNW